MTSDSTRSYLAHLKLLQSLTPVCLFILSRQNGGGRVGKAGNCNAIGADSVQRKKEKETEEGQNSAEAELYC